MTKLPEHEVNALENGLIFLVRNVPAKKMYSLAWRYSQSLVNKRPKQERVAVTSYGFKIRGTLDDYLFRSIYFTGKYEQEIFNILDKLVDKTQLWMDLGSNIGYFSLYLAQKTKQVISLDANPNLIKLLDESAKLNNYPNIHLVNNAVSNVSGEKLEFYIAEKDLGRSSLLRYDDLKEVKKIETTTITVDEIVNNQNLSPFGMKIDIEGFEINALKGATELLRNKPPKVIVMELSQRPEVLAKPDEIISYLKQFGYTPYIIRGNSLQKLEKSSDVDQHLDPNAFFIHESFSAKI